MLECLCSRSFSFLLFKLFHLTLNCFRSLSPYQLVLNSRFTFIADLQMTCLYCIQRIVQPVGNLFSDYPVTRVSPSDPKLDP